MNPLIEVRGLELAYFSGRKVQKKFGPMDLDILPGEALGLIGESGAGKSTLGLHLLGLLSWRNGAELSGRVTANLAKNEIAYIPQDPLSSLDPLFPIGNLLRELHADPGEVDRALEMAQLSLDQIRLKSYPHELSGGMCQRLIIAMALLQTPKFIIADEPTSSLDVITASEILALFRKIRANGISILFITHNLALAGSLCDRIAVMKEGIILETGRPKEIFASPGHPYTRSLIGSIPPFCYE